MTPLELVHLARCAMPAPCPRRTRELMDREYASPLDVAEVARVALMPAAPNIVPRLPSAAWVTKLAR